MLCKLCAGIDRSKCFSIPFESSVSKSVAGLSGIISEDVWVYG